MESAFGHKGLVGAICRIIATHSMIWKDSIILGADYFDVRLFFLQAALYLCLYVLYQDLLPGLKENKL